MNRGYTIYAVDFDGTLCESVFPDIGNPNMTLINHLIKRRNQGNKLILWTCRVGERLAEADCVGKVIWDDETLSFQVTERLSSESYEVLDECCVIGNIFDNPELLSE